MTIPFNADFARQLTAQFEENHELLVEYKLDKAYFAIREAAKKGFTNTRISTNYDPAQINYCVLHLVERGFYVSYIDYDEAGFYVSWNPNRINP